MPTIPREFINELLSRCDIVELIHARVPLKKKGNNYSACCPFHTEKTPSFTVSAVKQFYHCFGCSVSGNAISFLMEFDHLTFVESIEELARQQGVAVPQQAGFSTPAPVQHDLYSLLLRVTRYYQQQLRTHSPAIDYLKQRGLTGEIAKEFLIGYAPDSWDSVLKQFGATKEIISDLLSAGLLIKKNEGNYYDRFRDRIIFPIRDRRGRVIGFGGRIINTGEPKYLNSPETPIFHKGSELYGLHEACNAIRDLKRLIVVEGYMDTIALVQQGIKNVVATLGTATTADHLQRLFRIVPEVIFCFDGDKAGRAAAWRALEVTLPLLQDGFHVRFLLLPEGEDPDSIVRNEGAEKFIERCDQAQLLADFFFQQLCAAINLSTAEGKAQLTKLAAPLINKIPGVMLQHLLFERLASLVRIEIQALKQIAFKPETAVNKNKIAKPKSATIRRTPMRSAIALLIQNPQLAQSVSYHSILFDSNQPGSELLKELVNLLQEHTDMTVGLLLEYWRERPEGELLQHLAAWDLGVPQEVVEQEFLGIIGKLVQLHHEQEIETLMQKANNNDLSSEEKETLKNLITTMKK
jgi:DNA primase